MRKDLPATIVAFASTVPASDLAIIARAIESSRMCFLAWQFSQHVGTDSACEVVVRAFTRCKLQLQQLQPHRQALDLWLIFFFLN
jgi:hypothetical protein